MRLFSRGFEPHNPPDKVFFLYLFFKVTSHHLEFKRLKKFETRLEPLLFCQEKLFLSPPLFCLWFVAAQVGIQKNSWAMQVGLTWPGAVCVCECVCVFLTTNHRDFLWMVVRDATVASREQQSVYCNRTGDALCLQNTRASWEAELRLCVKTR